MEMEIIKTDKPKKESQHRNRNRITRMLEMTTSNY